MQSKYSMTSTKVNETNGLKTTIAIRTEDASVMRKLLGNNPTSGNNTTKNAKATNANVKEKNAKKSPKKQTVKLLEAQKKVLVKKNNEPEKTKANGNEVCYKRTKTFYVKRLDQLINEMKKLSEEGKKIEKIIISICRKKYPDKSIPITYEYPFLANFNISKYSEKEQKVLKNTPEFTNALKKHNELLLKLKSKQRVISAGLKQFEKYCGSDAKEDYINSSRSKW